METPDSPKLGSKVCQACPQKCEITWLAKEGPSEKVTCELRSKRKGSMRNRGSEDREHGSSKQSQMSTVQ